MPVIKSAIKKLRRDTRRTVHNDKSRADLRDTMRKVRKGSISAPEAYSVVDKSVKWNLIHANKGSRLKSKISKSLPNPATKTKKVKSKINSVKKSAPSKRKTSKSAA